GRLVSADVIHAALLTEVRRLRGMPWTNKAERRLLTARGAGDGARLAQLASALEEAQRRRRNNLALIEAIDAPTADEIATFRERGAEISAHIADLNAQLKDARQAALALPGLQQLHKLLTQTEIRDLVDQATMQDNHKALRSLVLLLV